MPDRIKYLLTALIVIIAGAFHYFQAQAGQQLTQWVALGLGVFMILAIWLFPEARGGKKDKDAS